MIRPITDTLRLLEGGAFLDRASEQLAALVKGIEDTGKSGRLTIQLDLKQVSGGAISITPSCSTKVPEVKPDSTLLWATVEGNLSLDNPRQQKLDLRQVGAPSGELKTA